MKTPDQVKDSVTKLEAKLIKQLEDHKEKMRKELCDYIVAKFKEVSYAEQELSLRSKATEHKYSDGTSRVFGSYSPCIRFAQIGMVKERTTDEVRRLTGEWYTGVRHYYVEKPRRYVKGEYDSPVRWKIDEDCTLSYDKLMEIAVCLAHYQGRVGCHTSWNFLYDHD